MTPETVDPPERDSTDPNPDFGTRFGARCPIFAALLDQPETC